MIYAFTSAALNYLPKARLCLDSLRRFHPEFRLVYALADRLPAGMQLAEDCVDEVIPVEDLPGIGTPGWIFQHSIVELSTGIKGAVLQRLLARDDCEAVLYFDPDIVLFSRLDDLVERLMAANIVLTPHQAKPEATLERIIDNEIGSLRWGIFNLGFLGVRKTPTGLAFADWWAKRLSLSASTGWSRACSPIRNGSTTSRSSSTGSTSSRSPASTSPPGTSPPATMTGKAPEGSRRRQASGLLSLHRLRQRRACDHGRTQRRGQPHAARSRSTGTDRSSRQADNDMLAAMPWAYGRSTATAHPIDLAPPCLRHARSLRRAFPDPFDASPGKARWTDMFLRGLGPGKRRHRVSPALRRHGRSGCGLEAENARLKEELRLLKSSLSWRLTKPLRAIT